MICEDIMKVLEQQAPEAYACSWDNVGLLVGSKEKEIQRIYVALDATDETIREAISAEADMLLTHHPLIFKGIKQVNTGDFIGRRVIELVKNDMAYYAMHTNFDISGMAQLAAEKLCLSETRTLQPEQGIFGENKEPMGIGVVGMLPKSMTLMECIAYVKKSFAVDPVKVFAVDGALNEDSKATDESVALERVTRIAVCPGSGKGVIEDALKARAQVLVTGDIDHHEGIDAVAQGMAILDAGHYGLEKMFIPYMQAYLKEQLPGIDVIAQEPKQPFVYR